MPNPSFEPPKRAIEFLALLAALHIGIGCSDEDRPPPPAAEEEDLPSGPSSKPAASDGGAPMRNFCAGNSEGCPCDEEGKQVDCGKVLRTSGDYISCSVGKRTCTDGVWGECIGDRVIQIASDEPPPFELSAVPSPQTCINNPCDPYCMEYTDGPEHVDPGGPVIVTDAGVTLGKTLTDSDDSPCDGIDLFPSPQVFVIDSLSALHGPGSSFGLLGQYYDQRGNNIGSTWTPEVERIDGNVDFYWGSGSPATGIGSDNFSVRWTGTLVPPTSGGYTFHLTVSDGARLWLNGSLLLDAWSDRAPSELSTSAVQLSADQAYDFKLETYENANTATASLAWSGPATSGSKATIDTIYFRPASASGTCPPAPPASSCTATTLEAESMTHSTGAAVTNGWNIYSNGYVAGEHDFGEGESTITVTARSDYINYAWANMVVSIGGSQVYTTSVDSSNWKAFSFPYAATAGAKEVRVQFTNDYSGAYGDRNLYVDKVHIACAAAPASPSAPCEATPSMLPEDEAGPEPAGTLEDPITSGRKRFEVVGNPKTCVDGEIQAAWTIDKLGIATIDNTGLFEVVAPVAGDVTINAYAGNFVATGVASVIVNVRDDADVSTAVSAKFDGPGSGTDPMQVLYPYVGTVFPLGVRAPVVQWDKGGSNAAAVRIALTAPNFLWEQIVPEPADARFEIPLGAWKALEQTAKGGEAAIVVQRLIGSSLRGEVVRPFEFATAPLRGQIIYTEYGRGSNEHAYQMAANPGSTSVAVNMFRDDTAGPGPNGQCPVCHSVSADGTTFITSDGKWSGYPGVANVKPNGILEQLSDYSSAATYQAGVTDSMDFRGFAWAPITPDGKYAFATNNFWGNTTSTDVGFSGAATTFPSTLSVPDGMKSGGNGTGLLGHYYANTDFSGTPWLRLDPYIRFDWAAAAPSNALNADAFSVRWQGELQAFYSEDHTFYVTSSDGVRLSVGGQVVIDQLAAASSTPTTHSGTASLVRGQKTEVVLELVERGGSANVELSWESASTKRGVIPQTQLYWDDAGRGVLGQYFDNNDFTAKQFERVDPEVSGDWGDSSPALSMNGETFSVRWDGRLDAPIDGSYKFCVTIDDHAKVTIDGSTVLDLNILDIARCSEPLTLEQGLHDLRVDYHEDTGIATMRLDWEVFDSEDNLVVARERIPQPRLYLPASYSAPTSGVTATYYDTRTFNSASPTNPTNPRALTRIEAGIDHDWGASTTREDYYRLQAGTDLAARYTGLIEAPCTGFTQFRAYADDGAQLWIDRVLIASRTTPGEALGFKYMTEGEKYEFKLDWNHASVNAFVKLEWRPCGAASWALVPGEYFHPEGDVGDSGFVRLGGDNANGAEYWAWQLTKTADVASTDVTASSPHRWGLEGAAMMAPSFAPDGSKLVFVDGDQDGGAGWRKGLSLFDFDASSKVFSNRRSIVNTWPFGHTIKWPTFESDSRSVVYSAGPSASRCCVNIRYTTYGNMAPTDNYESPGRLYSVDSESTGAKPVALARASNGERNIDANKAWQPTMLPVAAGGYRWVVFTSTRPYGNTINTAGQNDYSSFKSYSPMLNTDQLQSQLWVAAVDDAPSGESDRSHPAFWLPNQRYNEDPSNGMINERGFWALDPCRPVGDGIASTCEVDEDCCGGGGDSPTAACKIDVPVTYPVTRHCAAVTDGCGLTSQACAVSDDCCAGLVCADSTCQEPPGGNDYTPANFERVYQASCKFDATPEWHFFDWQATTPDTNAYIDFYVQTAEDPAQFVDLPPVPSPVDDPNVFFIGRAIGPSSKGSWIGTDIGALLAGNGVREREYVKITARLVPNQELTDAPILHDFRLNYSCPPNQ